MPKIYKEEIIANFFIVIFILSWAILLATRLNNFGYYDWDLAFFSQAVWQLAHGSAWSSLFGVNFFSNHANFMAVVIAPFYLAFPHPLLLVFLKIVSVAVAGWVIFRVARQKIGGEYALWVLLLFFIYAPNVFGILYEFDMEALAPGVLALMYYFYVERRWRFFMLMAGIAILIKENMPLVVVMFGLHALFTREDKWKWGVLPLIAGAVSFIFLMKVFIPWVAGRPVGGEHPYISLYAHLGSSMGDVLYNILLHPVVSFQKVYHHPLDLIWMRDLLGGLLFLPLFAPGILLLILPLFAQHFLSVTLQQHTIFYNYSMTLAPFIFLALVVVLGRIRKKAPARMFFIMSLLVIMSTVSLIYHWPGIEGRYAPGNTSQDNDARRRMLSRIGPDVPVLASFCFLPALANRKELYAFHKVYHKDYNPEGRLFNVPSQVRWALIDTSDGFYQQALANDGEAVTARVDAFLKDGRWEQVDQQGPVHLFRRD